MKNLNEVIFEKQFVENFPGDETGNRSPRQTPGMLYSKALPTPVSKVSLLAWSDELAEQLEIKRPVTQDDIDILGGNKITGSMYPYAACYAGHQFGNWAGQLGDGRAITLGELVTSKSEKWELQLKGAGPTAYSRRADGRAVLRSSVREYLMSEAMHYLRVPTTRALSLVTTGDQVLRDMFYDGHAEYEPGAIVMRVAPSFIRFGSFEQLASRQEKEKLQALVDWTIEKFYPHINGEEKILTWFKEVVEKTARLIVEWMRVGFVHGVMNSDNMSILGLTIDYGPYSFVDNYDPLFTPNTTDLPGRRYAYSRQPSIGKWNLACLASAIIPLVSGKEVLQEIIDSYDEKYSEAFYAMMANKLGLDELKHEDVELISALEKMLAFVQPDMTIFYQLLATVPAENNNKEHILERFSSSFYRELSNKQSHEFVKWITKYSERKKSNSITDEESLTKMNESNPRFILRNYLLHQAIEELEKGDNSLFLKLQQAMKEPYSDKHDQFFEKRPIWANQKAGCSMLSCSS